MKPLIYLLHKTNQLTRQMIEFQEYLERRRYHLQVIGNLCESYELDSIKYPAKKREIWLQIHQDFINETNFHISYDQLKSMWHNYHSRQRKKQANTENAVIVKEEK